MCQDFACRASNGVNDALAHSFTIYEVYKGKIMKKIMVCAVLGFLAVGVHAHDMNMKHDGMHDNMGMEKPMMHDNMNMKQPMMDKNMNHNMNKSKMKRNMHGKNQRSMRKHEQMNMHKHM